MNRFAVLALAALLLLSTVAFSQGRMSVKDQVKAMTERLNLTTDQAAKIDSILTASQAKVKELFQAGDVDRAAIRKIMEDSNTEVQKLLDEKQKAEFQKMQEERRAKMQERRRNND